MWESGLGIFLNTKWLMGIKKKRGAIGLGVGKVLGGVRGAQKQKEKYQL